MKAHYFLAQAQIALHRTAGALGSVTEAHRLCVKEVHNGGKGGSSIGPITELFLRCKKEAWEDREKQRLDRQPGLVRELQVLIQKEHEQRVDEMNQKVSSGLLHGGGLEEEQRKLDGEFKRKTDDIQKLAAVAGIAGEETKKRVVPDWAIDDITFSVMVDPVVVRLPLVLLLMPLKTSYMLTIFTADENRSIVRP
jgi:STIP1 family protein 1